MNWLIEQVGLQSDIVIALPVLGVLTLGLLGVVFVAGVITFLWGLSTRRKHYVSYVERKRGNEK